jgi:hypothetical protein
VLDQISHDVDVEQSGGSKRYHLVGVDRSSRLGPSADSAF